LHTFEVLQVSNTQKQSKMKVTKDQVYDIFTFLIGGYGLTISEMEKYVLEFLKEENLSTKEAMNWVKEAKTFQQADLELEGYFDY
jgi:hypothetical protein